MARPPSKTVRKLLPVNSLVFVSESKIARLNPNSISLEAVGQKTFGLSSLPEAWTLPFFGISAELFKRYESAQKNRRKILSRWTKSILTAAQRVGIKPNDEILVRSSGSGEGITARGKFYSTAGVCADVESALTNCLEKLANDTNLCKERIPLVIQKRCGPEKAKGHVSNERRCYEENRDWMGEVESTDSNASSVFQIHLRHWRERFSQKSPETLSCSLFAHISEALKIPADWAYRKKTRVHFEWVWNGNAVYIVQADEESEWDGHDPAQEHEARNYKSVNLQPQCLRRVTADDSSAARFAKIANVFTYLKLNLPTAPLYILDDQKVIRQLREVDEAEVRRRSERLDKKTDRRKIDGKVEIKASISVPVTRSTPWDAQTQEEHIESAKGKNVTGSIKGVRSGNRWNIEVSVYIDEAQLEMFSD
jgi:hypothetical protein